MKNKSILIITPFFAPETHAAVFRAHKLVKYLRRYGWEPFVLTVDINYNYNEDQTLLDDLSGIKIYRAKYIEPSLRGLKMFFGGKDRSFKTIKNSYAFNENSAELTKPRSNMLKSAYSYMIKHLLNIPDRFWTWENNAIALGKKIIADNNISYIYTTSLPLTTGNIGVNLKRDCGVQWVADFRDPITYAPRMHSEVNFINKIQKKIEEKIFITADKIVCLSSSYKLIYNDIYESKYDYKTEFIPTGADDDFIPSEFDKVSYSDTIIFIGEYLREYGDIFFEKFRVSLDKGSLEKLTRILIIGNIIINENILQSIVRKHNLTDYVSFLDNQPQVELYKIIKGAKAVLLIPGYNNHWWNNFAKMVDYIALKKLVLAIVPDPSEARKELTKAGLGIFLDEEDDLGEKLELAIKKGNTNVNELFCKTYLASSQTRSFIKIFESLE